MRDVLFKIKTLFSKMHLLQMFIIIYAAIMAERDASYHAMHSYLLCIVLAM